MKKTIKILLILVVIAVVAGGAIFLFSNKEDEKEKNNATNNETATETVKEKQVSMGEWNDDVYTNDFLDIKFTQPEGWTHYSKEEIAKMMNLGQELLNDDQKASAKLAELTSAYYMVANNPNTGASISIISEKPAMEVSEESYINQLKTQLSQVEAMTYEIGETSKETVAGREYKTLTTTVSAYGITQKYYVYKMDKYFIGIIVTSTGRDNIDDMMKCFE